MLFGNTFTIAKANARNALTPLQTANKDIKKYTAKVAKTEGATVKANDKYNNLINKYYNDLAYARNAKITALDTPDAGDIWSSPEAAQSYYWQTVGNKKITSLSDAVQKAVNNNAKLASELSKYQNMLQESEQDKSYAIEHQMQMENIFTGIFEAFLGLVGASVGFLM